MREINEASIKEAIICEFGRNLIFLYQKDDSRKDKNFYYLDFLLPQADHIDLYYKLNRNLEGNLECLNYPELLNVLINRVLIKHFCQEFCDEYEDFINELISDNSTLLIQCFRKLYDEQIKYKILAVIHDTDLRQLKDKEGPLASDLYKEAKKATKGTNSNFAYCLYLSQNLYRLINFREQKRLNQLLESKMKEFANAN